MQVFLSVVILLLRSSGRGGTGRRTERDVRGHEQAKVMVEEMKKDPEKMKELEKAMELMKDKAFQVTLLPPPSSSSSLLPPSPSCWSALLAVGSVSCAAQGRGLRGLGSGFGVEGLRVSGEVRRGHQSECG